MKKITFAVLLLFSALAWAKSDPNPAEYTINVHVSSSRVDFNWTQGLSVVIEGKKYELRSESSITKLLALGDYKARLAQDEHKTSYDSVIIYEFLFPDKKTRRFMLVGESE